MGQRKASLAQQAQVGEGSGHYRVVGAKLCVASDPRPHSLHSLYPKGQKRMTLNAAIR